MTQSDDGNAFLLVIAGPIVGFTSGSVQQMATEREVAERAAATAAERARLARAVRDGVLQVLALVQRRGPEPAGQQERELRRLIRAPLTERETEVLRMVAKGLSNRQIAERLVPATTPSLGTTPTSRHCWKRAAGRA